MIGIIVAILAGLVEIPGEVAILIAAGAIVGLMNITNNEAGEFLTASIVLILVSAAWASTGVGGKNIIPIIQNIVIFVSPAAFVVALKTVWKLAKNY